MTQQEAANLPSYHGDDLGAVWQAEQTAFRLWAPTADGATLRRYATGTDGEPGAAFLGQWSMQKDAATGVWAISLPGNCADTYYDYALVFGDRTDTTADPYARACGAGGARSMVIDMASAAPAGWEKDAPPKDAPHARSVWEVHVADFSYDEHSGVPAAWRGKFMAFTAQNTSVDGAGGQPTCLAYLQQLGVSHVQLQPIFDYATVDEIKGTGYNWGYDPANYNVPEGSYATDAFHGAVRVKECRAMVQALHAAGLRVVMDVVYNHTYDSRSWLERAVPGYVNRRWDDGSLTNGSGCGCDLASERPMVRKYLVDSVLWWAKEYHIDGFRFDLMALEDVDTMNAIREALDALPGGQQILMYGEPWQGGATRMENNARPADKGALSLLSDRIGVFCDDTRDAIKGSTFDAKNPGYVNGGPYAGVKLLHAIDAWMDGHGGFAPKAPWQVVQYVSAHDNFTLWDKLMATANRTDYDTPAEDVLAQNRMAAGIYLTCRGLPFWQAGEEFARTKYGDGNSYKGPIQTNRLDWRRAAQFAPLAAYYTGLLAIRRRWPELSGAKGAPAPILLAMPGWVIGFVIENQRGDGGARGELAVFYNPEPSPMGVPLPSGNWRTLCDGFTAQDAPFGELRRDHTDLPPRSVTILLAE